ncbi:MAG: hypothetical protein IKP76_03690 [Bacilli bacterium]|nr:hypothetical protein [Bacilli bacterium]
MIDFDNLCISSKNEVLLRNTILKYVSTGEKNDYLRAEYLYLKKMMDYQLILNQESDEIKKDMGLGFALAKYEFKQDSIITDFIAKQMVISIFNDKYRINLEDKLHIDYENKEDLKDVDINQYICNIIAVYDKYLADYVSGRIYLIDFIKKQIDSYIKDWDKYEGDLIGNSYELWMLVHKIFEDMEADKDYSNYDGRDLCMYATKLLGVDCMDDDDDDFLFDEEEIHRDGNGNVDYSYLDDYADLSDEELYEIFKYHKELNDIRKENKENKQEIMEHEYKLKFTNIPIDDQQFLIRFKRRLFEALYKKTINIKYKVITSRKFQPNEEDKKKKK